MKTVTKRSQRINAGQRMIAGLKEQDQNAVMRYELIQMLVPVGLLAVEEEMQQEVKRLSGPRYQRGGEIDRWGYNEGSVYLGDQKVAIRVPRVRNGRTKQEVSLSSYRALQNPGRIDEMTLKRVIQGISQRRYGETALKIPSTFGIEKSSVSRRFVQASGRKLRAFLERDLSVYDFVALIIDGKNYAGTQIVVAMGITVKGEKIVLGFTEANTENYTICKEFLGRLINRGLRTDQEILVVLDGAKGLRKGVLETFREKAHIQRCQWHKRENVVRHLDQNHQVYFRRKLQAAYEQPTYEKAKQKLDVIRRELRPINESAVASLDEGLEETLTLHRLKMFTKVGISLKTTNCLENVNKYLGYHTDRVNRWRDSDQKRRWVACALMIIEPRLRFAKGREFLLTLRDMMRDLHFKTTFSRYLIAA